MQSKYGMKIVTEKKPDTEERSSFGSEQSFD